MKNKEISLRLLGILILVVGVVAGIAREISKKLGLVNGIPEILLVVTIVLVIVGITVISMAIFYDFLERRKKGKKL